MTRLAIVGAMHEEIAALRPCLGGLRAERRAGRDFHFGRLQRFVCEVAAPYSRDVVREALSLA